MRVLVYGMQSGGATAFTLFLAQRPDCLALVDILNNYAAPRVTTTLDMVVKTVITTAYPPAVHMERFRPDLTDAEWGVNQGLDPAGQARRSQTFD